MNFSTRQFGWCLFICLGLLTACVTVNVYFPAAAAEEAADQIIDEIWGEPPAAAKPTASEPSSSQGPLSRQQRSLAWGTGVLNVLVPVAQAAPNLNVNTPGIKKLKASMGARNNQLKPFYQSGAVGLTRDGRVAVRDMNTVPGNQRKKVNQLVAGENRDRNALYREIAKANGHPEWEANIRAIFAAQWINKAPGGYWVQGPGGWRRK